MGINASKGNANAIRARQYVSDWILANPVAGSKPATTMGAEAVMTCGVLMTCAPWQVPSWLADVDKQGGDVGLCAATHILSRRGLLTPELIQEMAMGLEEGPRKLFWWGVATCCDTGPSGALLAKQPDSVKGVALAGKAVGRARKVQMVIAGAPISVLSRQAGIEHGE